MKTSEALRHRSADKATFLDQVTSVLEGDERIAAVWLFGSEGRREADGLSDLDLCVAFADHATDELDRVPDWLARLGPLIDAKESAYNAPEQGRYFGARYPARCLDIVVDTYWQPVSAAVLGSDTRVLVDKVGLERAEPARLQIELMPSMRDGTPPPQPKDPLEALQAQVEWFWFMITIASKHLARGWDITDEVTMFWAVVDNTARYLGAPVVAPSERPPGLRGLVGAMEALHGRPDPKGLLAPERSDAYAWLEVAEELVREGWAPS